MYRPWCFAGFRMQSLLLAGSLGLCACSSGLASLENKEVSLYFRESDLYAVIRYDYGGEGAENCITLHGFKATLNGIPFDVLSAGLRTSGIPLFRCELPRLKFPAARFPTGSSASILISDDSAVIRIDLPTLFAPRTLSVASQAPGLIGLGEEVVLSWTPETDYFIHPSNVSCVFVRSDRNVVVFSAANRPGVIDLIDSQHVRLRVPTYPSSGDLPATGTLSLSLLSLPVDRCTGAQCFASVTHGSEITLVAP